MNANYSIQLTEGDYTATYTIYYNSVSASNIATLLTSNLPADGLSLTTMLAGVNISVPGTANLIIVVGDGYCANSIEFQIVPIQTPVPPPDLCLSFIGDGILYSWQFTPNSTQNNKTKWESIQNGTTYTMYWNPFVVPNVWQVEVETKLVFISTNTTDIPDSSWTVQGSGSYGPITNLNVIQGTCPDIEPITTKSRAENNLCSDGTCTGIITVLTTLGGTPPYQYSLDNSVPTSSTIFNNVCPGQHDLETIDSNGLTNTTQVTIQQGQIPETYSLDIVYSNVNVSSSVDTDIKKVEWAITTRPALPVGASVLFELILDSTQTISAPGTGVITIDEKTYLNNVLQTPLTNENTSTSNRTDGCSAFQKSKKTQASSYYITLTSSSVLTGTTVSTLNIPTNSGSLYGGCVTKLEQSLSITINNFKFLGTCSNTTTPERITILDNQLLYVANSFSWRKDTFDCEGSSQFEVRKTIEGLSSPSNLWYDSSTTPPRVWVVDLDNNIEGNIYWFNPQTATSEDNMNYYTGIRANSLYNNFIDTVNKKIYLTGTNIGGQGTGAVDGLFVFDMQTQTHRQVSYGDPDPFQRQLMFVTSNYIYCKQNNFSLIRFDRSNPQSSTSVLIPITSSEQSAYLQSGAQKMVEVGNKIWVVAGSGGDTVVGGVAGGNIGIFDEDFVYVSRIVLNSVSKVNLNGNLRYWQSSFYDTINRYFYVCDFGGKIKFRMPVDTSTYDRVFGFPLNSAVNGVSITTILETKDYASVAWTVDPVTRNLYEAYALFNTLADNRQIYKTYQIKRSTGAAIKVIDNKYISNVVQVDDGLPNSLMGSNTGLFYWSNAGGTTWNTDGTITFFNNTVGGGNTGKVFVRTLRKWNDTTNQATTQIKPNLETDLDYIQPYIDDTVCPLEIATGCPSGFTKTIVGTIFYYEFDVPNGVQNNTANIDRIKVSIRSDIGNTVLNSTTYNRPFNDYNIGSFTVNNILCNLILEYIKIVNGAETVIKTCTPN
jgi:hypothetical protein